MGITNEKTLEILHKNLPGLKKSPKPKPYDYNKFFALFSYPRRKQRGTTKNTLSEIGSQIKVCKSPQVAGNLPS